MSILLHYNMHANEGQNIFTKRKLKYSVPNIITNAIYHIDICIEVVYIALQIYDHRH